MKKSDTLLIGTAIIWAGVTVCATIAPENYLYIMIIGGLISLGSIRNARKVLNIKAPNFLRKKYCNCTFEHAL